MLRLAGLLVVVLSSAAVEAAPRAPGKRPAATVAKPKLQVVRVLPASGQAVLQDGKKQVTVNVGEKVAGYTLIEVDEDGVTLGAKGKTLVLPVAVALAPEPAVEPVPATDAEDFANALADKPVAAKKPVATKPVKPAAPTKPAPVPAPVVTQPPAPVGPAPVIVEPAPAPVSGDPDDPYAHDAAAPTGAPTARRDATPATTGHDAPATNAPNATAAPTGDDATASNAPTGDDATTNAPAARGDATTTKPSPATNATRSDPADPYAADATGPAKSPADPYGEQPADPYADDAKKPSAKKPGEKVAGPDRPALGPDKPAVGPDTAQPALVIVELGRRDVDAALEDFGSLLVAVKGELTPQGAKIEQVTAGTLLARVGLRAGDVVASVDGKPLRSLDDAANLYARAGALRVVTVQVVRGGKPLTLRVVIK
jgi:type II secretory pathway component PulC